MTSLALVTAFPPSQGSLNEYGYHLANALAEHPELERLVILADRLEDGAEELELSPKIEVRRVWRFNDWLTPFRLAAKARSLDVDGVIFNLQTASFGDQEVPAAAGLMAPALTRFLGRPSSVIAHNIIDAIDIEKTAIGNNRLRASLVRRAGKVVTRALLKANYVTVTLDSFSDILEKDYHAENAYMVPHGSFPSAPFRIDPVSTREPIIATMGKFGTYKRLERLIEAFQHVRTEHPDLGLKLRIGGSDHPATPGYVAGLKTQYETDHDIEFVGYVAEEDVAPFFSTSRLAVFDYESTTGSSGVLHQAAGFGTPAAYPLIGDFVDVTQREGLIGYHYQPFETGGLADAIETAIFDTDRSEEMLRSNLAVSKALPISTVAAFHISMMTTPRANKRQIRLFYPNRILKTAKI